MKILLLITITLFSFINTISAQCDCETINREDNTTINQCSTLQVASNNNTQVGLSISYNQIDFYLGVIIRFKANAKKVNSAITIRLEDNKMFSLKLISSTLGNMGNSNICANIYSITPQQIEMLKNQTLKPFLSPLQIILYKCILYH